MRCCTLVLLALASSACGKSPKQKRTGDAAPVEVVTQPMLADAAALGTTDEIEPNDGDDVATALPVGATVRGKLEPDTDVDHYKLEVPDAGALSIDIPGVDGVDIVIELEDQAGTVIAKSDRGGARVREGFPNVGVTSGRYIAVVKAKKPAASAKKPAKGKQLPPDAAAPPKPAAVYEITANVAPPPANTEREPDDDRGTALDLIVGDTASGYVGWTGDADVWKLSVETLSEKNALDVDVSAIEGVALTVEVADGIGNVLATRKAPRGAPLAFRGLVPVVAQGAPPFHYLTIKGDKSNPETTYQLRVSAKVPGPDAELEPNDVPEKAMPFPADRTVVHGVWTPGDVDTFSVPADPAARSLEVSIDTPPESDLNLELLVDGKVVAKSEKGGKGAAEAATASVPAGATLVIRVKGTDASSEGAYDVKLSEGPAPGGP
ncbi:MAG: hypothetical protein SFX73_07590 [Kofleriaceae bacterium]|nr:hypothetical protein [Kofleriaceae bacterium]